MVVKMFNENTDLTREQIFARDGDEKSFVNNDQRRIQENFIDTFVGKMDHYFKRYFKKKNAQRRYNQGKKIISG